jgi:hypothetical protein
MKAMVTAFANRDPEATPLTTEQQLLVVRIQSTKEQLDSTRAQRSADDRCLAQTMQRRMEIEREIIVGKTMQMKAQL